MKALMKIGKGDGGVALRTCEKPVPKGNELLVRVHAAGICGTDVHILRDEYPADFPVVMGHEYSGIVEAAGPEADGFLPGDRVVSLTSVVACGHCECCRNDLRMLCAERKSIGSGVNGAFAEYLCVPADLAFHIPASVSLEEAALCEPLACVVRGVVEHSPIRAGDRVYVSGPGAIGLLTMEVAKACGAYVTVGGTDVDTARLETARTLGADSVINVMQEDLAAHAAAETGGRGYDVVYECAGAAPSARACLNAVRKCGHYQQVGLFGRAIPFDMDLALTKEVTIGNSYATERSSWQIALRLMEQGLLNLSPLISARMPLEQWQEAFRLIIDKEACKILFVF